MDTKDKIEIMLKEYETLKEDFRILFGTFTRSISLVSLVLMTAFIYGVAGKANYIFFALPILILLLVLFLEMCRFLGLMYAEYLTVLERRINKLAGCKLLLWSSEIWKVEMGIFHFGNRWTGEKILNPFPIAGIFVALLFTGIYIYAIKKAGQL